MTAPVFLIDHEVLQHARAKDSVTLTGSEGRHAVASLRIRVGEVIELVDGLGLRACGTVESVDGKESIRVNVTKVVTEPPPPLRITVVQALPKGAHGELAIDLLTQVGVDAIVPWSAERSVTRWVPGHLEKARSKWQSALAAAAKQSRRARWPLLGDLATTSTVAEIIARADTAIVLHEAAALTLLAVPIDAVPGVTEVVLVIGPEGGLSDQERAVFKAAGAHEARLGPTVLRSSSAGAIAVAILSATRNWGGPAMGGSTA